MQNDDTKPSAISLNVIPIKDVLDRILALARDAGQEIMRVYTSEKYETIYKEGGSPLTIADIAANLTIVHGLVYLDPAIPVLSEESETIPYQIRQTWETFWLIDPLDGTKEFINKNDEFTVNIALIEKDVPVVGVVYAPAIDRMYYAAQGLGAFMISDGQTTPIRVSGFEGGTLKVIASRSHRGEELDSFLEKVGTYELIGMGSSLKFCMVAEGSAHIYPRLWPTMEWDTAAAQCIMEEAGGSVTDLKGQRLRYNKPDLRNPDFIASSHPAFPWQNYLAEGM